MLVYHIESVDYLKEQDTFEKGYNHVPKYRQAKIDKLKRDEDKRLSLGAELLLEKMLAENGFRDLAEHRMGYYTEQGKPYILRPEQAYYEKPPVHVSISHSRNYTMCVLSDTVVGCDIEHADTEKPNCIALAKRFFNEKEIAEVLSDRKAFYRLWTLKEAYTKCTQIPLPVVLKMNMNEEFGKLQNDGKILKMLQGEHDGFTWSVVFNA